jgi:hypothetical protein
LSFYARHAVAHPVILATQKAEVRGFRAQGQPRQKVREIPISINKTLGIMARYEGSINKRIMVQVAQV